VKLRFALAAVAATGALVLAAPGTALAASSSSATTQALSTYRVYVHTSDLDGAGTDATVQVRIYGSTGTTGWLNLDDSRNNFERNDYDSFSFTLSNIGTIQKIDLWYDHGGSDPAWSLDYVSVIGGGSSGFFPYYNWLTHAGTTTLNAA
jgi:hypothetical protein